MLLSLKSFVAQRIWLGVNEVQGIQVLQVVVCGWNPTSHTHYSMWNLLQANYAIQAPRGDKLKHKKTQALGIHSANQHRNCF